MRKIYVLVQVIHSSSSNLGIQVAAHCCLREIKYLTKYSVNATQIPTSHQYHNDAPSSSKSY